MRRVVIESPYAASPLGTVEEHVAYARRCVRDCIRLGEAPIASHLLFTQPGILDDNKPDERRLGIRAGLEWMGAAEAVVVYRDFGVSIGMLNAIRHATVLGLPIEHRSIGKTDWRVTDPAEIAAQEALVSQMAAIAERVGEDELERFSMASRVAAREADDDGA